MTSTRQLAAIMFTDIVGYTALMGADEQKAMGLVRKNKDIQKPLVEQYNGSWLKEMGDGALSSFPTASDAINCALKIQEALNDDPDLNLRIGIHLGEIILEVGDVYGDGVNIASRLQSIAEPGGIYISDSVQKAIRGNKAIHYALLGELELKNVDYPVKTYALRGEFLPRPKGTEKKHLQGRLLAELNRRNVFRAGLAYLALAFIVYSLIQLITLSSTISNIIYALLFLGFPLSIYLAWNYERSPEGFVKVTSRKAWTNPYSDTQKKPFTGNGVIIFLLIIIAGFVAYPQLQGEKTRQTSSLLSEADDKSIAVLPFVNMSNDPEQEYFSDGMMEEILNHLVKIRDLKVTSRTTAMRYKGSDKSLTEIGQELNVATILEGSVRKSANKVRITVQLIDVDTDKHLWSETYDREFEDIFAIQSEVAQHVASSLQANVTPEVRIRIESQPTSNTEAYNSYLKGTSEYRAGNYDRAIELFEQAIEIDPKFASAYASLGFVKSIFSWTPVNEIKSSQEAIEIAMPYYNKALQIDSLNLQVHAELAFLRLWYEWDFKEADKEYQILKQLNPSYSWGDLLVTSGRFEEAVKDTEKGVESNPLSNINWGERIISLYFNNQHEEALRVINEALILFDGGNTVMDASRVYLYLGMYEKVVETIEKYLSEVKAPRPLGTLAIAYYHLGDLDKSNQLLNEIFEHSEKSPSGSPSFYLAMIYAQMGETDQAFRWLEKAYQDHEVEMYWLKVEPPFEPLRNDPRWQEMLEKVGFPE